MDQNIARFYAAAAAKFARLIALLLLLATPVAAVLVLAGEPLAVGCMVAFGLVAAVVPATALAWLWEARKHAALRADLAQTHPRWMELTGPSRWYSNSQHRTLRAPVRAERLEPYVVAELIGVGPVQRTAEGFEINEGLTSTRCRMFPDGDGTRIEVTASRRAEVLDSHGTVIRHFAGAVEAVERAIARAGVVLHD